MGSFRAYQSILLDILMMEWKQELDWFVGGDFNVNNGIYQICTMVSTLFNLYACAVL